MWSRCSIDPDEVLRIRYEITRPSRPLNKGVAVSDTPAPIPDDDPSRELTIARPDTDQSLTHIGLVGDTYTVLVRGEDTAGKYTLIDMHVPPNGGPPPPRPHFEEMFTVLEGEVSATVRGETLVLR